MNSTCTSPICLVVANGYYLLPTANQDAIMTTLTLPRLSLAVAAERREPSRPRLRSEELFRNHHELIIEHQGQEYRLRLTRNDKLILNK